jgi:hypothetical protein
MQEVVIAYLEEKCKTTKHIICLRFSRREFLQQYLRYTRGSPFILKCKSQESPYFHEE